jgi:aconitate hydratase
MVQEETAHTYVFDASLYEKRVYNGYGHAETEALLHFGPNIKDWPEQKALSEDLLIKIVSHIDDPVTTTDELIPSGETSSYRSNPLRLAEFTLSRRDPSYVPAAKQVQKEAADPEDAEVQSVKLAYEKAGMRINAAKTNIVSAIYANKPGDGSAREQAASCQRVLGGGANFAKEYATKRYRSNCINWGILPFLVKDGEGLPKNAWVYIPKVLSAVKKDGIAKGYVYTDKVSEIELRLGALTPDEKEILEAGCLINYYQHQKQ